VENFLKNRRRRFQFCTSWISFKIVILALNTYKKSSRIGSADVKWNDYCCWTLDNALNDGFQSHNPSFKFRFISKENQINPCPFWWNLIVFFFKLDSKYKHVTGSWFAYVRFYVARIFVWGILISAHEWDFTACFLPLKISFKRQDNNLCLSLNLITGVLQKLLLLFSVCIATSTYKAIQPPPSKLCGSPDGPSITGPRIKLRDGRQLAYKEHGVPRDEATHKIIVVHGSDSCRHDNAFAALLSPVL